MLFLCIVLLPAEMTFIFALLCCCGSTCGCGMTNMPKRHGRGKKTKNHQHLSVKMPVNVTTHPREFIYNSASMSALGEEHQWSNQHLSARHMLQRMNSGRADVWRRGNLQQQHSCHTCGATDDKVPDADDDRATVGWQEMTQEMAHLAGNSYMLGKYYSLTYSGSKSPELKELFN